MRALANLITAVRTRYTAQDATGLFLRTLVTAFLILASLASLALFKVIATQSNPFFYANF